MEKTKKLIEQLRTTKKIRNLILARSISKLDDGYVLGEKEERIMQKNKNRAFDILLGILPAEARNRIIEINNSSYALIDFIKKRSGCDYADNSFLYEDIVINIDNLDFTTSAAYCIPGDKTFKINKEKLFYMRYWELLRLLNDHSKEKRQIMNDKIPMSSNPELAESLVEYLGYREEETTKNNQK